MINLVDLVVGIFVLIYFLKNAGGLLKTAKNIIIILLMLMLFGIIAELVLAWPIGNPVREPLKDSYSLKVSLFLIKGVYPVVESSAPKVDSFIKERIISLPAPKDVLPEKFISTEAIPKLVIP